MPDAGTTQQRRYPQLWDEEAAERVIAELGYQATGWRSTGDQILANTAAALARRYAKTSRDKLANWCRQRAPR